MSYNATVKELENSEIEISAEIPAEEFESYRDAAVKTLGENTEIPGFRKGTAPESVLTQKVGEDTILYEMAQSAISKAYPEIVREKELHTLGRPQITLSKIARGNPLGFTAKTAVMPEVALPDYKKIAKETIAEHGEPEAEVTDEEVDNVIQEIRQNRAQQQKAKQEQEGKTESGIITDPNKTDENASAEQSEPALPELTDEFVKQLGDFKDVEDFKAKIRENLQEEKRRKALDKRRAAMMEAIQEKTEVTLPDVLVSSEQERMLEQIKDQIAQAGLQFEDYLKQVGKTAEQMKEEWKDEAKKRVRTQLVLQKIADAENLRPGEEEVAKQAQELMTYYPGAEEERVRAYVESVLTNEKVFEFLEAPDANNTAN